MQDEFEVIKSTTSLYREVEKFYEIKFENARIKYNCKTGVSMQVGKTYVFTRESLKEIQDKMRVLCIETYNKEYQGIKELSSSLNILE